MSANPSAIILAAGQSSRMAPHIKQLLRYKGYTFIEWAIERALLLGIRDITVVLGAHHELVSKPIQTYTIKRLVNPDWKSGMGGSLKIGLSKVFVAHKPPEGVLVMLSDQPLLMEHGVHLEQLIQRWQAKPSEIVATKYGKKYGVPAILPRRVVGGLLNVKGDKGARDLLNSGVEKVIGLDPGKLAVDIDTMATYQALLS